MVLPSTKVKSTGTIFAVCAALFIPSTCALARAKAAPASPPPLLSGLGDAHHSVSTKNPLAQQYFDQGLKLVYAFNHDEARRSFQHAAELDPKLALAWWGVALTFG